MIRSDPPRAPAFGIRVASAPSLTLADGQLVKVEVTGIPGREGTPIRIAGTPLVARGFTPSSPGEAFTARVTVADGTVFLQPVESETPQAAGAALRLGLPETPVTATLLGFFTAIGARLESRSLMALARLAGRFPGKETRAAEAAAILAERGIEPDTETVGALLACIEGSLSESLPHGEASDGSGYSRDLAAFVNHKKGHDLHWIIIPFSRGSGASACAGSVRLLLDTARATVAEVRIVASARSRRWEFALSGKSCVFRADPAFDAVKTAKMSVYLKRVFEDAGCAGFEFASADTDAPDPVRGVDVRI